MSRSTVFSLPGEVQSEVNQRIVDAGFSDDGYQATVQWLQELGHEQVSFYALKRYGTRLRTELGNGPLLAIHRARAFSVRFNRLRYPFVVWGWFYLLWQRHTSRIAIGTTSNLYDTLAHHEQSLNRVEVMVTLPASACLSAAVCQQLGFDEGKWYSVDEAFMERIAEPQRLMQWLLECAADCPSLEGLKKHTPVTEDLTEELNRLVKQAHSSKRKKAKPLL